MPATSPLFRNRLTWQNKH